MRLIDADAAEQKIGEVVSSWHDKRTWKEFVEIVLLNEDFSPTIDDQPVIRCKDCVHAVDITNLTVANRCGMGQKNCMRQRGDDGFGFAGVSVVYPDGFCDEGERRDDQP